MEDPEIPDQFRGFLTPELPGLNKHETANLSARVQSAGTRGGERIVPPSPCWCPPPRQPGSSFKELEETYKERQGIGVFFSSPTSKRKARGGGVKT